MTKAVGPTVYAVPLVPGLVVPNSIVTAPALSFCAPILRYSAFCERKTK